MKIGSPNPADAPAWHPYFFDLAKGDDLIAALVNNQHQAIQLMRSIPASAEEFSYAENKWTVKQVFIHLNDEERYYTYKAFCCSRQTPVTLEIPMGRHYAKDFNAAQRTLKDITEEFITVRKANISLFKTITPDMLDFRDTSGDQVYSARSLGWFTVGHNIHHCNLIREKYMV